ncbi:hypothetical protein FQA47_020314 [Oryzias melastigma]|uniref:Uncharacterized protein n=1 Tax=Oryzias melastigma TaxID=30732 RepID=A0A834FLC6_ORYME|nr:hypothetical protein FQA47_020314 [Oryzias melastigma]
MDQPQWEQRGGLSSMVSTGIGIRVAGQKVTGLGDSEEQNPNPGPGTQLLARDGPHEAASVLTAPAVVTSHVTQPQLHLPRRSPASTRSGSAPEALPPSSSCGSEMFGAVPNGLFSGVCVCARGGGGYFVVGGELGAKGPVQRGCLPPREQAAPIRSTHTEPRGSTAVRSGDGAASMARGVAKPRRRLQSVSGVRSVRPPRSWGPQVRMQRNT